MGKKGIGVNIGNSRLSKKPIKTPLTKGSNFKSRHTPKVNLQDSMVNLSDVIAVLARNEMEMEADEAGERQ